MCVPWTCSPISSLFINVCRVPASKLMSGSCTRSLWPSLHRSRVSMWSSSLVPFAFSRGTFRRIPLGLVYLTCHLIPPRPQWWQHLSQSCCLSCHRFQERDCSSALWMGMFCVFRLSVSFAGNASQIPVIKLQITCTMKTIYTLS